jgi:tetratricopeptide (TPR) repeat protein
MISQGKLLFAALALVAAPAFAVDMSTPSDPLEPARAAIDRQDYGGAIAALNAVIATDPRNADALNLLGYASRKSGALDDAAEYYDAALAIDPDHFGALEYQGELFIMTGEPGKARANLEILAAKCAPCEEHDDLAEAMAAAGM